MSGNWITTKQVEIYMKSRQQGNSQLTSSAKAGISERTGRDIDKGKRLDPKTKERRWRTRKDPLLDVWDKELAPMLIQHPQLQAITLLEHLQGKYEGEYPDSLLRTLQRRVKHWCAEYGPDKEVMFRQEYEAGLQGLSDFTHLKNITITIAGKPLKHILYHFRLAFSKWSYMKVIQGGESYTALATGLQEALLRLGGSPKEHRTDSLSAAFKNLSKEAQDDMTTRYDDFCKNYSMQATRNNPGASHENGSIESSHGHVKRRIKQALLLRNSCNFATIEDYQTFIDEVVQQSNRRNAKAIKIERSVLQPLPKYKAVDYTEVVVVVTSSSTIDVRRVTYTVPSRLQGETIRIRLYDERLECYLGQTYIITLKRVYPPNHNLRARNINYRHVIHSLIKKPQAFRRSRIREDLLPNDQYKKIWQHADKTMPQKKACKFIVGLLYIAATHDCEEELADKVMRLIKDNKSLSLTKLQDYYKTITEIPPEISIIQHSLSDYNQLIPCYQEVNYG